MHGGTYLSPLRPLPRMPRLQLTHRLRSGAQAPPNRKRFRAPLLSSTPAAPGPITNKPAADAQLPRTAIGPTVSWSGLAGKRHVPASAPSYVDRIPSQLSSLALWVWRAPAPYSEGRVGAAVRPPRPGSQRLTRPPWGFLNYPNYLHAHKNPGPN